MHTDTTHILNIDTTHILNIGLTFRNPTGGKGTITPGAVLHEMYDALDARILSTTRIDDHEEPTLVVELAGKVTTADINALAERCWQEAIAVYDIAAVRGHLVGPQAAKWGGFDATRFVLPSGKLLSDRQRELEIADARLLSELTTSTVPSGPYAGQPFKNAQPLPLHADTAIWSVEDSPLLASLGIFSIDRTEHRQRRQAEQDREAAIAEAYAAIGADRNQVYREIAEQVAPLVYGTGIWVTSSGEYTRRRDEADRAALAAAEQEKVA